MNMLMGFITQALGSTGLFASRTFLPALAAALVMRYGPQIGLVDDWGLLGWLGITTAPTWFTSDWCILTLTGLSILEVLATKNPDARAVLRQIDRYLKPGMAMLTYLGVVSAADAGFISDTVPSAAGMRLEMILAPLVGLATFFFAESRAVVFGVFGEADEDDDLGVQKLMSWAEDIWGLVGGVFLILFPILMLALVLLVVLLLLWLRRRAAIKERDGTIDCPACEKPMCRCALRCPHCNAVNPDVLDLDWLGLPHGDRRADLTVHPYRLAAARRCPVCATRLKERRPDQQCPNCGHELFSDPAFVQAYVDRVGARLPGVVVLGAVFSLVPIIGLIPGIILYRLALTAPLRRYIPRGRGLVAKWGVRLLFVVLVALQIVPIAGMITVPVMAVLSFITYRTIFLNLIADRRNHGSGSHEAHTALSQSQ